MAIKKNTAAASAASTKTAAAVTKPASKTAVVTKTAAKVAEKTAPVKAEVEKVTAEKVSRKDLAELIQTQVKAAGKAVPLGIAEIMVVAYEEAVQQSLAAGKEVNLPGFGKFVPVQKEATTARNPSNGETVNVPAHVQVRFKVGAKLKAAANGGTEVAEGEDGEAAE